MWAKGSLMWTGSRSKTAGAIRGRSSRFRQDRQRMRAAS